MCDACPIEASSTGDIDGPTWQTPARRSMTRIRLELVVFGLQAWLMFAACGSDGVREGMLPGQCTDRADNDGDGKFDCEDDGCKSSPDCQNPAPVAAPRESPAGGGCSDGEDNDGNGKVDCGDEGCLGSASCGTSNEASPQVDVPSEPVKPLPASFRVGPARVVRGAKTSTMFCTAINEGGEEGRAEVAFYGSGPPQTDWRKFVKVTLNPSEVKELSHTFENYTSTTHGVLAPGAESYCTIFGL